MRNDPFSHDPSKGEGLEQKKSAFDVNIVFNEGRGKERTKMKHKHKTVLIDKGNCIKKSSVQYQWFNYFFIP